MFKDIDQLDKGYITAKEFYDPILGLGLISNYGQC